MSSPPLVNLPSLIDDAKCYGLVRQHRWPEGVRCPRCGDAKVVYRPRLVRHRTGPYAARAATESCSSLTAAGGRNPCRSISHVAL
jgi:DNA-directed RNA polymerase subunit RPC12/RpoP